MHDHHAASAEHPQCVLDITPHLLFTVETIYEHKIKGRPGVAGEEFIGGHAMGHLPARSGIDAYFFPGGDFVVQNKWI